MSCIINMKKSKRGTPIKKIQSVHYISLKPEFSHEKKTFTLEEMKELLQEEVVYLPEMGRMITPFNSTSKILPPKYIKLFFNRYIPLVYVLRDVCEHYKIDATSLLKAELFSSIQQFMKDRSVVSPPVKKKINYLESELVEYFGSEVKNNNGRLWVYKNTTKKELDMAIYGKDTKKSKIKLFESIEKEKMQDKYSIRDLCTLVGTKVIHCEDRLITYNIVKMDYLRGICIKTGYPTTGDKATLFARVLKVLKA